MFESDEAFELALSGSGIVVSIPQATYTLSEAELSSLDAQYAERSFRWLVACRIAITYAVGGPKVT